MAKMKQDLEVTPDQVFDQNSQKVQLISFAQQNKFDQIQPGPDAAAVATTLDEKSLACLLVGYQKFKCLLNESLAEILYVSEKILRKKEN